VIDSPILKEAGRRPLPPWLSMLHAEMGKLADKTSRPGWDRDVDVLDSATPGQVGALPIGVRLWSEALMLAIAVSMETPGLPVPVPGADPKGFIWLTWSQDTTDLALQLQQGLLARYSYVWDTTLWGVRSRHESVRLKDVMEALQAAFGYRESDRRAVANGS
jgi:hypothetical protein